MILGIILVTLAITYAIAHRTEPLKIIYSGVALLVLGGVFILAINIALSGGFARGSGWEQDVAVVSIYSALAVIPSGVILTIVGIVMNKKSQD